jgi:hypothetical protein
MSGNQGNWGRRRLCSPCYYDTSITALNTVGDSIRQLQAILDEEQRTMTTLRGERNEVQNRAKIWEQDSMVLRADHCRLQDSF